MEATEVAIPHLPRTRTSLPAGDGRGWGWARGKLNGGTAGLLGFWTLTLVPHLTNRIKQHHRGQSTFDCVPHASGLVHCHSFYLLARSRQDHRHTRSVRSVPEMGTWRSSRNDNQY